MHATISIILRFLNFSILPHILYEAVPFYRKTLHLLLRGHNYQEKHYRIVARKTGQADTFEAHLNSTLLRAVFMYHNSIQFSVLQLLLYSTPSAHLVNVALSKSVSTSLHHPTQIGVAMAGGAEAAVHAVRRLASGPRTQKVINRKNSVLKYVFL